MAMKAMKATMQDTKVRKPTALSALPQLRSYFRSCDPCINLRTTDVTVVYFDCSMGSTSAMWKLSPKKAMKAVKAMKAMKATKTAMKAKKAMTAMKAAKKTMKAKK